MKLTELYIENFGGLSRYKLDFEPTLTSVIESNGFGKTTLAEFIRAMLYGFPRKSKTLEKSRRQKYAPWNGGTYGGYLIFEHEGQRYRLERTFGANPKADTFSVIDLSTNKKTARFGEEIGQEIFGLDADSFERSTYLPQNREDGPLATASIQAKLSDLVEDTGDVGNYDKAIGALRSARSALIPYRGRGGSVAEAAAKITELQLQLDTLLAQEVQLKTAQETAALAEQDVETLQTQLAQVCEKLQTATQQEADILHQQQYAQLVNRHSKAAAQLDLYRKKYPCGLPQEEELRRAEVTAQRLQQLDCDEEKAAPDAQHLAQCRALCDEHESLRTKLYESQLFAAQIAGEERQRLAAMPNASSGSMTAAVVALILGVAGLLAGAALLYLKISEYAVAALGIGAAVLITGVVAACVQNGKKRKQEQERQIQQREMEKKLAAAQNQVDALRRASEKCSSTIAAFFAQFEIRVQPQQYLAALTELEYRARCSAQQQALRDADSAELSLFFEQFGQPMQQDIPAQLRQLREDMRVMEVTRTLLQTLAEQRGAMEKAYGDILSVDFCDDLDPRQLRQEEVQLRRALTETTNRMLRSQQQAQQLQREVVQIPQTRQMLEQYQCKMAEDREKAEVLDAAMEYLQQAKENLATAYMGTIRSSFGRYFAMLEGDADEKYLIDPELHVQLERQGQVRELAYFSAGQTDLVMLCMRLALVDALFQGQETFIILDDPFVNLDDTHLAQAQKLLHHLAQQRQILYLSCHSSREI